MKKYDIIKIELGNILFIEYTGDFLPAYYGEIEKADFIRFLKDLEARQEIFYDDMVRNNLLTFVPRRYIDTIRDLEASNNIAIAYKVYRNIRAQLNYPKLKNVSYKGNMDDFNIPSFINTVSSVINVKKKEEKGKYTKLVMDIITDSYKIDTISMDISDVQINYDNILFGYNETGEMYILSYEDSKDDESSIFISFNPIDNITYLRNDDIEKLLQEPVDSNEIRALKKEPNDHDRDNSYLYKFIETGILNAGINNIYIQALIPYMIKQSKLLARQYRNEIDFIIESKVDRFEILLRTIAIVFKLDKCFSTVRVTPYKKLFNEMDRRYSDKRKKRIGKKKIEPFDYTSHDNHMWRDAFFRFTVNDNGDYRTIPRRNNDMIILLLLLFDEMALSTEINRLIYQYMRKFRSSDNIVKIGEPIYYEDRYMDKKKHAKPRLEVGEVDLSIGSSL